MAEGDPVSDVDQLAGLPRQGGPRVKPQVRGGPLEQVGVPGRLGGGDQQELPLVRWQGRHLAPVPLPHVGGQRQRMGKQRGARQLLSGQLPGHLGQGEGIPRRVPCDLLPDHWIDDPADQAGHHLTGRVRRQAPHRDRVQALPRGLVARALPDGEQERDPVRVRPPRDEGEHVRRGPVEPLGVIDQAQDPGLVGRRAREQGQYGQPDQEPVRNGPVGQPESRLEGSPLRSRQVRDLRQQGLRELVDSRVAEFHFRFDSGDAEHPEIPRGPGRVLEQGGLPDSRLAPYYEGRAETPPRAVQRLGDRFPFPGPSDQPGLNFIVQLRTHRFSRDGQYRKCEVPLV
jgi:hypothetical protein